MNCQIDNSSAIKFDINHNFDYSFYILQWLSRMNFNCRMNLSRHQRMRLRSSFEMNLNPQHRPALCACSLALFPNPFGCKIVGAPNHWHVQWMVIFETWPPSSLVQGVVGGSPLYWGQATKLIGSHVLTSRLMRWPARLLEDWNTLPRAPS